VRDVLSTVQYSLIIDVIDSSLACDDEDDDDHISIGRSSSRSSRSNEVATLADSELVVL